MPDTQKKQEGHDFISMEKRWLKHWYDSGVISKYLHKNDKSQKYYSFQDGPITANNPMGVHHAWGRTYKDLWQKYHNLRGFKQRFQNGFDCQGLWVEVEVEKELKLKSKKDIENLVPGDKKASIAKFVQLCKDRVMKYSGIQTDQSKRLAYFMDWEHSYFTMSDDNNYMIWKFLKVCFENGWIYKGNESVPWCPRCETAISQHEMLTEDYKELVHEAIYFELPLVDRQREYLLVWTTTPWTLPANIAVAVDADIDYSLVEGKTGDLFWIAKDLVEKVFKKEYKVVKTVKGEKLVGLKYRGPFDEIEGVKKVASANKDTFHTVVATDPMILPISTEEGTGLVHTAVSAGIEDFKLGKKLGLPMIAVIADNADYLPGLGFLSGKNAKKHPEIIFDYLKERETKGENWIFEIHRYKHRYPACWRCKAELVWKVADEWYIAMDKPSMKESGEKSHTLRERMIKVAQQIKWMPEFGLDRELDWLKNMHDWLISKKNRYWGLSLPIYECKSCGHFEVIGSKEDLKKRAVSGWAEFEGKSPHKPYIDEVTLKCEQCGKITHRIDDVGNPWLDAGIVPFSTISADNTNPLYDADKKEWLKWYPVDFITESFPGQFKNWFYALIAEATVLENSAPFKRVLGFGTLLGEDGRPMHKSWGNSIEFNEGADKIGVDVMRWMFARENPADNMLFGYKKADEVRRKFYLILWNVYKFYKDYSALDSYKHDLNNKSKFEYKNILDVWINSRFGQLVAAVEKGYEGYNIKDTAAATELFVNDLSTWFIRRSRNRVFIHSNDEEDKKSFYGSLYNILVNLTVILSPILPFISEEIYTELTGDESVHLSTWPNREVDVDERVIVDMEFVREIVEIGHRVRKESKMKLRQPLASASIKIPKGKSLSEKYTEQYHNLLMEELNVKSIKLLNSGENIEVLLDTSLTSELIAEGKLRDLIRSIQAERKMSNIRSDQKISIVVPKEFTDYEKEIRGAVLFDKIKFGDKLSIF